MVAWEFTLVSRNHAKSWLLSIQENTNMKEVWKGLKDFLYFFTAPEKIPAYMGAP